VIGEVARMAGDGAAPGSLAVREALALARA
jgi:hypothetical protein